MSMQITSNTQECQKQWKKYLANSSSKTYADHIHFKLGRNGWCQQVVQLQEGNLSIAWMG